MLTVVSSEAIKKAAVSEVVRFTVVPEQKFKVAGAVNAAPERVIERKATWKPYYHPNFVQGASTEVYAMKRAEDVIAIQRYFIDRGKYRDALYVVMSVNMGLRGVDMTKLRWCDILTNDGGFKNPDAAYIYEQKTGKKRPLIFNRDVIDAITMYLNKTGIVPQLNNEKHSHYWVFPKQNGVRTYRDEEKELHISRMSMGRILKSAAKAVGIKYNVNTHTLRKTFGYRLYKSGTPIEVIQKIFNHSDSLTTSRYIGLTLDDQIQRIDDMESVLVRIDRDEDE